tara:strand:+ start:233 stop:460 length:228 start_codon:yes stop_codon:yes gene_type:complete
MRKLDKSPLIYIFAIFSLAFCSAPLLKGMYSTGLFFDNLVVLSMGILILPISISLLFLSRNKLISTDKKNKTSIT